MKQQEAIQLKKNDSIIITNDKTVLNKLGIPELNAGRVGTVSVNEPGNNRIIVIAPLCGTYYLPYENIEGHAIYGVSTKRIPGIKAPKTIKPPKFSKKDVDLIATQGANAYLKEAINTRIAGARSALTAAGKPEDFHTKMKEVAEQLRQAKLLRAKVVILKTETKVEKDI